MDLKSVVATAILALLTLLVLVMLGYMIRFALMRIRLYRCIKLAEGYAGYDRLQVLRDRLWQKPGYWQSLQRGITQYVPDRWAQQLAVALSEFEPAVVEIDRPLVRECREVFALFVDAVGTGDPNEYNLAMIRLNHLGFTVRYTLHHISSDPASSRALAEWTEEVSVWTVVAYTALRYVNMRAAQADA